MAETGRKKRLPELGRLNGRGFLSKLKETKEGSPLKLCPGGSPSRPHSPEPNCSICLGGIEDQSFANKCFHSFCKTCLFEWSKVKPECPVCRQGFDSIIFNVKAMDDYEEFSIPRPPSPRRLWSVGALIESSRWASRDANQFNILRHRVVHLREMFERNRANRDVNHSPRRLSFIYSFNTNPSNSDRTPPTAHAASNRTSHMTPNLQFDVGIFRNLDNGHQHQHTPSQGTCAHRRYIYERDLWVQPIKGRLERECSATFYRNNPAVTHRLLPFLNRELLAICTDTDPNQSPEALLSRIKAAIFEYDIPSIRFRQVVEPFIGDKTHHFLHELFYFAKSPYTIEDYNAHAVYLPRAQVKTLKLERVLDWLPCTIFTNQEQETDSSTDDSVIEVVDSDQEQSSTKDKNRMQSIVSSLSVATATTETTTKPNCDEKETRKAIKQVQKISKEMSSQANQEIPSTLTSTLLQNINVIEDFDNPRPGPSGLCRNTDFKPSNSKTTVDDDESDTEIDIGTDEKPSHIKKQGYDSDSEDSDDSIKVVGFKKPMRERTPEIINISSCGESDKERDKSDDESDDSDADDNGPRNKKLKIDEIKSALKSFVGNASAANARKANAARKMTDSDGSDVDREKSTRKKQKRRHRSRWLRLAARRCNDRELDLIDRPSRFEPTSSDSDSDSESAIPRIKRNQINIFKMLRRIPSVIVAPSKTKLSIASPLPLGSYRPANNTNLKINNTSPKMNSGNGEKKDVSPSVNSTLCSTVKRKFESDDESNEDILRSMSDLGN